MNAPLASQTTIMTIKETKCPTVDYFTVFVMQLNKSNSFESKDGAYYCCCASRDIRISLVLINTGIFFAQFKTTRRKQNLAGALDIQKRKLGVTMHFQR